jgi:hypothetical protein
MNLFLTIALLAMASAAPVISLDLNLENLRRCDHSYESKEGVDARVPKKCVGGITGNKAIVCPAKASDEKSCGLPTATAYDHHDGLGVDVTKEIYMALPEEKIVDKINYNLRSEYFVLYDAVDSSGNEADTVTFTVVINDLTKPEFGNFSPTRYVVFCSDSIHHLF